MKYKKLIKFFFLLSFSIMLLIILVNYIIDPFQQYRRAKLYKTIFMTERYLNAGLAKNYLYDSVVIGSSMTQNFIISEIEDIINYPKTIKLTTSGASIFEEVVVLNTAINSGKVENVLLGLDVYSLSRTEADNELPLYLYDNDIINDYNYLFNLDTFKRAILYPFLPYTLNKRHPRLNYNRMYEWQYNFKESDFNENKVIKKWKSRDHNFDTKANCDERTYEFMKNNFDNILLPVLKRNTGIKFTIFYPPYSILAYKIHQERGALKDFIKIKSYIFSELKKLSNVRLYDFQSVKKVTHNLKNYKDVTHYHQRINKWMLEQIRDDRYRVTTKTVELYERKLLMQIKRYTIKGK